MEIFFFKIKNRNSCVVGQSFTFFYSSRTQQEVRKRKPILSALLNLFPLSDPSLHWASMMTALPIPIFVVQNVS